jgi:hypothetical protein
VQTFIIQRCRRSSSSHPNRQINQSIDKNMFFCVFFCVFRGCCNLSTGHLWDNSHVATFINSIIFLLEEVCIVSETYTVSSPLPVPLGLWLINNNSPTHPTDTNKEGGEAQRGNTSGHLISRPGITKWPTITWAVSDMGEAKIV